MTNRAAKPQATLKLAARLLEQAHKLLATVSATPTERPATCPTSPRPAASPRVAKLLRGLGVTAEDFRAPRNSSTPRGARAVTARRAVVEMLAAEGLEAVQLARETGLSVSTVREYLPR